MSAGGFVRVGTLGACGAVDAAGAGATTISSVSTGSTEAGAGASGMGASIWAIVTSTAIGELMALKVKMPKLHTATSMDTTNASIPEELLIPDCFCSELLNLTPCFSG